MRNKTGFASCILLLLGGLARPATIAAQAEYPKAIGPADVVSAAVATGLAVAPLLFHWGPDSASCAPCDPADLPAFDRWVVHEPIPAWSTASSVVLYGLGAVALVDMGRRDHGSAYVVAAVEAGLWAEGVTAIMKAAVGRARPVLYTDSAVAAAGDRDAMRSFPSGHTALAFSLATSYWFARKDLTGAPGAVGWLGFVAAAGVGVMRIAGGKHFPSDVVAGALLGTASGIIVHTVKF